MSPQAVMLSPEQARRTAKIIWFALCMGLMMFSVILITFVGKGPVERPSDSIMIAIPWVMTLFVIPLGLFIRGQVFKKNWEGNVVTPAGYMTGNIIAWACCESPAFISVVFGCFIASSILTFIPGAIAFLILLSLYPNGKAMFPLGTFDSDNPYRQQR